MCLCQRAGGQSRRRRGLTRSRARARAQVKDPMSAATDEIEAYLLGCDHKGNRGGDGVDNLEVALLFANSMAHELRCCLADWEMAVRALEQIKTQRPARRAAQS